MASLTLGERTDVEHEEKLRHSSLIAAGLVSEDPDADDSVVYPLPPDATITTIVVGYNTKATTGNKVRCAACSQHQPHHRGFRVELADGRFANIGFNCGEKHFGEGAWQTALSDYERRVTNAHYQARIAPTVSMLAEVLPVIENWHNKTKELAKRFSGFNRALPELYLALGTVARSRAGRLELEKRVRRDTVNRTGLFERKTSVEVTEIGRIPYPEFFLGTTPNAFLSGAKKDIADALALLDGRRDTTSLARAFRALQQARQRLGEAADAHRGVLQILDVGWLTPLCKWANASGRLNAQYMVDGRSIIRTDSEIEWSFDVPEPDVIGQPPIGQIEALWRTTHDARLDSDVGSCHRSEV